MHTHRHARLVGRQCCQCHHHGGVVGLAAYGGAIFAVERHVEDAGAEFFDHFSLQLQAFAHARLNTAVVVTHRQHYAAGLCTQQGFARMNGHCHGVRCAMTNMRGNASSNCPSECGL